MGSTRSLHINSIRLMETSLNLRKVISAITAFDFMISEGAIPPKTYFHGKMLSSLFNYILNDKLDKKWNKYILKTFKLFITNKKEIYIDLRKLHTYNEKDDGTLVSLIVNELKTFSGYEDYMMNMENNENVNILTPQLLNIFDNINDVYIDTQDIFDENKNYIFSLAELLSVIADTTVKTVRITGRRKWMKKLWESSSGKLVKIYARKKFDISMDKNRHGQDFIMITRS